MIYKKRDYLELGFFLVNLVYFSEAILPLYFSDGTGHVGDVPGVLTNFMQLFSWFNLISILIILVKNTELYVQSLKVSLIGWLVLTYVLLSSLWSLHPIEGFKLWELYVLAFLFGVFLARRLWPSQLALLISLLFIITMLTGWFFVFFKPWLGLDKVGSWRGSYLDRNEGAFFMNIAFSTLIALWNAKKQIIWRYYIILPLMALTLLMIWFSGSATGRICFVVLMVVCVLRSHLRGDVSIIVLTTPLILLAFVITAYFINVYTPEILKMLGKDETLTGRTEIWKNVLEASKDRPWFGYGAEQVFVRAGEVYRYNFTEAGLDDEGIYARPAHNLYLALLIKYGVVGCVLFFLMYMQMAIRALKENRLNTHPLSGWYILVISNVFVFGGTLTIDSMEMVWLIYGIVLYAPTAWKNTYIPDQVIDTANNDFKNIGT